MLTYRLSNAPTVSLLRRALAARRSALGLGLAAAVALLAGCGGSSASAPSGGSPKPPVVPQGATDVTVVNDAFTPSARTVAPGATVTWTWNTCTGGDPYGTGQSCVDHGVVWDAGGTGSPVQSRGTYQRQFATAGVYAYHCAVHGAAMSGTVTVQ